jgi:hypothetical protein
VILSPSDIESFIERGHCRVEQAFDERLAAPARSRVWEHLEAGKNIKEHDRSTWPPFCDIEEHIDAPEVLATFTDRLCVAIEELEGHGRWAGRRRWGLWPINFGLEADLPYSIPQRGWHVDGNWFRHALDCPLQGLLVMGLFTDIAPRGGGTLLAQGSHKRAARVLARHPEGMTHTEFFNEVLEEPIGDLLEVNGASGDVFLIHPWLFHTRSMNHSGKPRIMSNTEASLKEPMCFERHNGDHSILETSIIRALAEEPRTPPGALRAGYRDL